MNQDKKKLLVMATGTLTLIPGIILYAYFAETNDGIDLGNMIPVGITAILVVFMIFFIVRRYRDVKQGLPLEDERSKKIITLAAAKSFYISLYWLLAISWFDGLFAQMFGLDYLDASQTVGGGIAGMAICFAICWWYYDRKPGLN